MLLGMARKPDSPTHNKPAAKPKEALLDISRRDPDELQLKMLLDVAERLNVRPGLLGAIIDHESARTWHPEVRPSKEGGAAKVSESGKVVGKVSSSASGISQYIEATWMHRIYSQGEELIKQAELDKHNPAAAKAIRETKERIDKDHPNRTKDWNFFDGIMKKDGSSKKYADALSLRNDPTSRIPMFVLGLDVQNYEQSLRDAKLPVNATNVYVQHHTSFGTLRELLKNQDAAASVSANAQAINGAIFTNSDGSVKTGGETYKTYENIMSNATVSNFERKYFGAEMVAANKPVLPAKGAKQHAIRTGVEPVLVAERLVFGPPSKDELKSVHSTFDTYAGKTYDHAQMGRWAAGVLKRSGLLPATVNTQSPNAPEVQQALKSFGDKMGLAPLKDGKFAPGMVAALTLVDDRVTTYTARQAEQKAALEGKAPKVDLKALKTLPADDPARKASSKLIVELKQNLTEEGLLKEEKQLVRVGKKKRYETKPLTDVVDDKLLKALAAFQMRNGLISTNGVLDPVTLRLVKSGSAAIPVRPDQRAEQKPIARDVDKAIASRPKEAFDLAALNVPASSFGAERLHGYLQHEPENQALQQTETLKRGNKAYNLSVDRLQQGLIAAGYGDILGESQNDGRYGGRTEKAVEQYMRDRGLSHSAGKVAGEVVARIQSEVQLAQHITPTVIGSYDNPAHSFNDIASNERISLAGLDIAVNAPDSPPPTPAPKSRPPTAKLGQS
jgi:peptidoglycan hydrolase-like protein with peptidoglycan-binding domain